MSTIRFLTGIAAILFAGAVFGFFYAWVCSTMWGLDAADPRVAIAAMQAMNASVRNPVFFPAFFLTPIVMVVAAWAHWRSGSRSSAWLFSLAAAVYLFGGLVLTMIVNVPMNEQLAVTVVPGDVAAAEEIWIAYSGPWQTWNVVRTVCSGISLALAAIAVAAARVQPLPSLQAQRRPRTLGAA